MSLAGKGIGFMPPFFRRGKVLAAALALLLLIPLAYSLGVTPGRTTLNFEGGLEKEVRFTVLNNENKDMKIAVYARGPLADYIEIPVEEMQLGAGDASKEMAYNVRLPDEIDEPGLHDAEIVIREITAGAAKEITVGAMQAVVTQLHVNVPYPGKYIQAKLDIVGGKRDKNILFFVPLFNFGREDVIRARAEIIIMDMYQKVINKVETNELPVPAGGRAELSAQMDSSPLFPGIYRVIASVGYDGFTTTAENTIYVEDFLLIPLDISVRDFNLGDIAKFNILIENIGNIRVEDASSLIMLYSKTGATVANTKSVPTDFEPMEKKEVVSYWDTKDVRSDEYSGNLLLSYGDKSDERRIITLVGRDSINVEIIGVTGYAVSAEKPAPSTSPVALIAVLLALINLGWFVFYFMSRKKR